MNNPNDNLRNTEKSFVTTAEAGSQLNNSEQPSKNILISTELETKNQLGQLSKLAQNKDNGFINAKILSGETLIGSAGKQRILPSLVQTFIGLFFIGIITALLTLINHDGIPFYWIALPIQAYWSYWLFMLNRAFSRQFHCSAPLSLTELVLICALNYALLPLVTDYSLARLLDPFFYLWLATLAYVPFKLGKFVDQQKNENNRTGVKLALWSVGFSSITVLLMLIPPYNIDKDFMFGPCWFLSQCGWITYFALLLSGLSAKPSLAKEKQVYDGTNIVIRYRAYPELEHWFEQKFGAKKLDQGTRILLMWFGGPALVIFIVVVMAVWFPTLYSHINVADQAAAAGIAKANVQFILQFILGLILAVIAGLSAYFIKPTHLGLGEKGMRFLWRRKFLNKNSNYIPWSEMTNIYIEQKSNQTSANATKLCFRDNHNRIKKIRLNAIDSYEDKQLLLNAIRTWAPEISRDARVIESLQPPSDYSYTELWLQALSAPPKRERFKPLIKDAVLRNQRYRVLNSLGSGGQGFAYLVEDCSNKQEVVLKEFILPVYVDINVRKSALKQFENETRILSQLQHPQIVRLLDFFVEDHRAYLVLEHIDGASLRTVVESNGALSMGNTVALANQMCDTLSYLHSQIPPVVHRDFTPDNLILDINGTLKLIDFNVAQNSESTTTGTVVGKPAYLPPEQFRGVPTTQSDIYAMGATLYFMLTAVDPTPISVSHPAQNSSDINATLDNIVARATDLDLTKRYPDIAALKNDLAKVV